MQKSQKAQELPIEIQKEILNKVLNNVAKKLDIHYHEDFNLGTKRSAMQEMAKANNGWTLFINKKGSLCKAFYKTGTMMLLESPEYMDNLWHSEHSINYFINRVRKETKEFF